MGTAPQKFKAVYNVSRIVEDMSKHGWNALDLARETGLAAPTVTRFLRGEVQTARTARRLAKALGYSPRRYVMGAEAVA